ncbi:MAG: Fur family transcriptional regulator [Candidatus Omnitrophota bacterium]|nr:Fur family transcriptional regulator [Candidatus Omnitrophota bacterium]
MTGGERIMPQWWHGRFGGRGYRITLPRKAILDVLGKSERYLSAEEIYLKIHKIYRSIGLSTVYRTLELFIQMGLIVKFDFGDGKARYKPAIDRKKMSYNHLICVKCRRVIDYSDLVEKEKQRVRDMQDKISKRYDFEIKNHFVNIYGLCSKCKKER